MSSTGERTALSVTADQRRAADPGSSVWVAASAGSGKTKALTDRVVRLLLGGARPERLLCLTFTKAAAAEMSMRINRRLGDWTMLADDDLERALEDLSGDPPDAALRDRARCLFAEVLDAPGGLNILTIHAFCQSLLGRFPLEAGVAPHFEVLDERETAGLLADAQNAVLARARGGENPELAEALDVIALHAGEESFIELMTKLRDSRSRLRRVIEGAGSLDAAIAATFRLIGVAPGETPERIIAEACAEGAFNRDALAAACRVLEDGGEAERKRAARLADWLAASEHQRWAGFDDYRALFLTAENLPRRESGLMTKPLRESHGDALAALLTEQRGLARTMERRNAAIVGRATAALLRLGGAMLGEYDRRKQSRARLDYDDLILGARDLLRGPDGAASWVLYKLDGGIDHILIDEAQDTSPEQWQVASALADEFFAGKGASVIARTLFIVGDEKQSIFSFQGADLKALATMRATFRARVEAAAANWDEIGLETSFRSTPVVLKAVDTLFALAEARDGVVFDDHRIKHQAHRRGHAGLVELWPLATPRAAPPLAPWSTPVTRRASHSPRARLAREIADRIAGWLRDGERLESRDRAIRPGDIMVLVRTRSGFVEELVRALKGHGVAVAGADRMMLAEQLAVMDLVAVANFLLLPEDDLTLAVVLKGPLIGLTEDELYDLAQGRVEACLWRELVRRRGDNDAFAAAHEALSELLARVDYTPPFELFADLLGARGARRKLIARLGPDANDPIDEFLSLALAYERGGPPSLQGFLHWLAAGDVQVKRDLDQGRDEVRVMTVHGAKGLEAPIVIMPDTTKLPYAGGAKLLWHDGEGVDQAGGGSGVMLWPGLTAFDEARCRVAREAARIGDLEEYRRLLYVAMTRAEDRLYIAGWQTQKSIPEGCWYRLVEAGLSSIAEPFDFDGWDGRGLRLAEPQTATVEPQPAAQEAAAADQPLPAYALGPPPPEPTPPRPLAPSHVPAAGPGPAGGEDPEGETGRAEPGALSPLAGGADDDRFLRGRLIHRLLQTLPEIAPGNREAACGRMLARIAPTLGDGEREGIAGEVLAVLEDRRFRELFGPGSRAEAPLIGVVGNVVVSGQVDRLVVGDRHVMVIDYKSNRPPPRGEADVAPVYVAQMAAYKAVLTQIYPEKTITCALLWTDGPRLMALSDEILERYAP